jgi:hypothetical protein
MFKFSIDLDMLDLSYQVSKDLVIGSEKIPVCSTSTFYFNDFRYFWQWLVYFFMLLLRFFSL